MSFFCTLLLKLATYADEAGVVCDRVAAEVVEVGGVKKRVGEEQNWDLCGISVARAVKRGRGISPGKTCVPVPIRDSGEAGEEAAKEASEAPLLAVGRIVSSPNITSITHHRRRHYKYSMVLLHEAILHDSYRAWTNSSIRTMMQVYSRLLRIIMPT